MIRKHISAPAAAESVPVSTREPVPNTEPVLAFAVLSASEAEDLTSVLADVSSALLED